MIRLYQLSTANHEYIGMEISPHADIVAKHKEYKFNPELAKELDKGHTLEILKEVKSLNIAEELLKYYVTNQTTRS